MGHRLLCVLKVVPALLLSVAGCARKDTLDEIDALYKDAIISCERMHSAEVGPQVEVLIDPAYDFDPKPKEQREKFYWPE